MKKYILFIFFLSFCGSTPAQDVAIVDTDNSSTTTLNVTNITSPQGEVTLYHNSFAEYIDSEDYEYVILKNYKICCPENTYPNAGAKPFGYIDVFQDKLLFLANTGEIMYLNLMDFNQNVSTVPQTLIDSNIKKITNKFNFYRGFRSINNEATYDSKEPAIGRDGWGESFKDIPDLFDQ